MAATVQGSQYDALAAQLVEHITHYHPTINAQAHKRCKDAAVRNLKYHRYGRTNQFAVQKSLDGLVERFHVQGAGGLGRALQDQMDRFARLKYSLSPEVLSLMLHLSDRPLEKADPKDIDLLEEPESSSGLTWSEIIEDDPLEDSSIWEVQDYHAGSSEDDEPSQAFSEKSRDTRPSSIEDDTVLDPEALILSPETDALDQIHANQEWRGRVGKTEDIELSELDVLRESLQMLLGGPTSLFEKTKRAKKVVAIYGVMLKQTAASSVYDLLASLADVGNAVSSLRSFTGKKRTSPLLQTFASEVEASIHAFDKILCSKERQLANPQESGVIVSLLAFEEEVRLHSNILMQLTNMLTHEQSNFEAAPFRVLDTLLDACCAAQALGDTAALCTFSDMLFACLATHLTPLISWMQRGELNDVDEDFLEEKASVTPLSSFWEDNFSIRLLDGKPQTPTFLQPFVDTIFASGKSVAFLHRLGLTHLLPERATSNQSIASAFTRPDPDDPISSLIPIATTLHSDLTDLITSTHTTPSPILTKHLLNELGLRQTLSNLQTVFLSKTSSYFANLSGTLFTRLNSPNPPTRSILAELIRSTFSATGTPAPISKNTASTHIDSRLITVTLKDQLDAQSLLHPSRLHSLVVSYTIPAVQQNIITPHQQTLYATSLSTLLTLRLPYTLLTSPSLLKSITLLPSHQQRLALFLRHRLIWVLNTIQHHYMYNVIAVSIQELNEALDKSGSVDDLINAHAQFVTALKKGLLLVQEIKAGQRAVEAIIDIGVGFVRSVRSIVARGKSTALASHSLGHHSDEDNTEESDDQESSDELAKSREQVNQNNATKKQKTIPTNTQEDTVDPPNSEDPASVSKSAAASESASASADDADENPFLVTTQPASSKLTSKQQNNPKQPSQSSPSRARQSLAIPPRTTSTPAPDLDSELRLRHMRTQLSDLTAMLIAQLRTASRERGTEKARWIVLAERLEWGGR